MPGEQEPFFRDVIKLSSEDQLLLDGLDEQRKKRKLTEPESYLLGMVRGLILMTHNDIQRAKELVDKAVTLLRTMPDPRGKVDDYSSFLAEYYQLKGTYERDFLKTDKLRQGKPLDYYRAP